MVETGAVDTNAGPAGLHPINWASYYIDRQLTGFQLRIWEEDLRYILKDIQQTGLDSKTKQGSIPQYNIVQGVWNPQSPSQSDILNNVCQHPSCN